MAETVLVEDLGVMSEANLWHQWRVVRDPRTGREAAMGQAMHGGFVLVDPGLGAVTAIGQEELLPHTWASAQAPDGKIYQASVFSSSGDAALLCWDGRGEVASVVARMKCRAVFTMDAATDNRIYLPDYHLIRLFCYDPASREVEPVCSYTHLPGHPRQVCCGLDGLVYVALFHHETPTLTVWDPTKGCEPTPIPDEPLCQWIPSSLLKDSNHRIWAKVRTREGKTEWRELSEGKGIARGTPHLTPEGHPWWFHDGSRIGSAEGERLTILRPDGGAVHHRVPLPRVPLRVFSVAEGGGQIWGSTIIPLTLFRYDPETGKKENYQNPTATEGEIYRMVWASNRLFLAAYYGAHLSRFDPSRSWQKGRDAEANPRLLGPMKDPPLLLQRPYGKALDRLGRVFFSARGDYGCEDSGICRIDPATETVVRWVFPNTTLGPIVYLAREHLLLGGEVRKGESTVRFAFISPDDGRILESWPLLEGTGMVTSWLYDGGERVYGLYNTRAMLLSFRLSTRRIEKVRPELGMGHHCYECLEWGKDGRLYGLTRECLFAADRELQNVERVAGYPDHAAGNFYRFGMPRGPDGYFYFANGPRLMRFRA